MTEEHKNWIDGANYEMLLRRNRFGKMNDLIFQGDTGKYFCETLYKRKIEIGVDSAVAASKRIGWE